MAKISVQFHGLPQEIIEFTGTFATEHKLFAVTLVFFPDFKANIVEDFSLLKDIENINRICLSVTEPVLSANNGVAFSRNNPDCLSITIGKYDGEGLVESLVGAQTENKNALKIWRKIVKKIHAFTLEGAWVVNPHKNTKSFYKKHRYTEAAKNIAHLGVKMKPTAGWNYFIFGTEN